MIIQWKKNIPGQQRKTRHEKYPEKEKQLKYGYKMKKNKVA